jgi:hypothetical protein
LGGLFQSRLDGSQHKWLIAGAGSGTAREWTRPRRTVAGDRSRSRTTVQNCNFEAGTALENLCAEVVDLEALARAAEAAADALPSPTTDRQRLVFGRIQALATKTSE